eukprot:3770371-Rhodomonas_salina.2
MQCSCTGAGVAGREAATANDLRDGGHDAAAQGAEQGRAAARRPLRRAPRGSGAPGRGPSEGDGASRARASRAASAPPRGRHQPHWRVGARTGPQAQPQQSRPKDGASPVRSKCCCLAVLWRRRLCFVYGR